MNRVDYRLNAIVDGRLRDLGLARIAALAAENGATVIQYRDKHAATREMIDAAKEIRKALSGSGVPLLINDRVDVALAAQADGVHLGRDDMDPATARQLLGRAAIIGVTVKIDADADAAISAPIDYACIGGVFATLSKTNPDVPLGIDGFIALRRHIASARPELPVGAIAGIDAKRAAEVVTAGASGVAAIASIFRASDIAEATRLLRTSIDAALEGQPR